MRLIFVVTEDALGNPADSTTCADLRDHYGLGDAVVIDPNAHLTAYGENDLLLITDPSTKIVFKQRGASTESIVAAIERELGY